MRVIFNLSTRVAVLWAFEIKLRVAGQVAGRSLIY
jgi:hypothetical protein